jgi:putative lipase involved disintegration of autophagic bodies
VGVQVNRIFWNLLPVDGDWLDLTVLWERTELEQIKAEWKGKKIGLIASSVRVCGRACIRLTVIPTSHYDYTGNQVPTY